jgi:hypothetical protein
VSFDEGLRDAGDPPNAIALPEFDSLMMGYKDKSRFLPHDRIKKVFWGLGGINRTILLDGFVAGIWKRKKERTGMVVSVKPLRTLEAQERNSIEERFKGYGDYLKTRISVEFKT